MKTTVLIGATGFVGSHILNELVNRGYKVTAIARDISKIEANNNINVVSADINDINNLSELIKGHDAVISAYHSGWTNPNLYADFIKGSESIEKAVELSGVKRLIVIGGAGSLYIGDTQLVDTPDFPAEFKQGASAARDYLNTIKKNHSLDWTYFSPAVEMHPGTSGVRKGEYKTSTETPVFDAEGRSIISVEDVAVAVVDELEQNNHIKERFTAAYA